MRKEEKIKIACFGDSLTRGWIGYSYLKYMQKEYKKFNKGINGDTTLHVYDRLEKYIEKNNKKIDIFVLHVGINDILLPYIAGISWLWKMQTWPRVKEMRCIQSDEKFKEAFENYFKLFEKYDCKAIIVGMPMCQLSNFPNDITQCRNEIISRLAEKYNMPFIDAYKLQTQAIENPSFTYSWKHGNIQRNMDAFIMMLAPFSKDIFSKVRGINLTVDGVHYNSLSARLIGEAINKAVESGRR